MSVWLCSAKRDQHCRAVARIITEISSGASQEIPAHLNILQPFKQLENRWWLSMSPPLSLHRNVQPKEDAWETHVPLTHFSYHSQSKDLRTQWWSRIWWWTQFQRMRAGCWGRNRHSRNSITASVQQRSQYALIQVLSHKKGWKRSHTHSQICSNLWPQWNRSLWKYVMSIYQQRYLFVVTSLNEAVALLYNSKSSRY